MTPISKIDFTKCGLPDGFRARAVLDDVQLFYNDLSFKVATRYENGWSLSFRESSETIAAIAQAAAAVDSFIASETKRLEEEKLPPWRECSGEEAEANRELSEFMVSVAWGTWSKWIPMRPGLDSGGSKRYRYRTRALKVESAKSPPVRWEFERLRGLTPNAEEAGILQGVLVAVPKPDPALPKVKAPEGWTWFRRESKLKYGDNYGALWLAKDNDPGGCPVPSNKNHRDAMLACVAAYDEEHGAQEFSHFVHPGRPTRSYLLVEVQL